MSPYLQAFEEYHSQGVPWIPWTDVLDYHLQFGEVISNGRVFMMGRKVAQDLPEEEHATLTEPVEDSTHWHIWSAAGDLRDILRVAAEHGATHATFQRRNSRLHRFDLSAIKSIRHLFPTPDKG